MNSERNKNLQPFPTSPNRSSNQTEQTFHSNLHTAVNFRIPSHQVGSDANKSKVVARKPGTMQLSVPSIDLQMYRSNYNATQNYQLNQQHQQRNFKENFQYDQNALGDSSLRSKPLNQGATEGEDSSNLIASIITKICFDLSAENQQQLQIAHAVGLRVYEALDGQMRQYKQEIQNLKRALDEKTRRIQFLEGLQQNPQGAHLQLPSMSGNGTSFLKDARFMGPTESSGLSMNSFSPFKTVPNISPYVNTDTTETSKKRKPPPKRTNVLPSVQKKPKLGDSPSSDKSSNTNEKSKRWTKAQDEALRKAVNKYDGRNWKAIAEMVEGRDHVQCLQRWKKVLQPGLVKGHWTSEEDAKLLKLIQDKEMHSWAMVAEHIKGRTAKQCRERWSLNLDPSINRSPWTMEEDALLLKLHAEIGGKWAEIKQQFEGRTENAVKTRFKSIMRAKAREWTEEQDKKLIELRAKYGKDWMKIAAELPGRSKNAIKVRCRTLAETNLTMRSLEYPHLNSNNTEINPSDKRKQGLSVMNSA